ncbi:MAG: hypothetical protein VW874_02845 [Gammaproteobacteria bacterium]|jgi:hypothetical protein
MKRIVAQLFLIALLASSYTVLAKDTYIVANAPVNASLDDASLLALLKGERRNWDDGNAATVVLPSRESEDFEPVAQKLFGTSGRVMQRLWFRLVFSGRVNAPVYVDDTAKVIATVEAKSGAVGILLATEQPVVPSPLRVVKLK